MDAFSKKLLASLAAIAVIASAFTGLVITGTAAAQSPTCPLDEDFSSWLPGGWTTDDWIQSYSNYAGGTSPEAVLSYYAGIHGDYAYLDSKPVDTTGASHLTLEFKSFIDDYCCSDGYNDPSCYNACPSYSCRVLTRADGGDSWTDVTPWSNPISGNVGPNTYSVDISSDIGSATQVRFEFDGYYYAIDYWYVDDVKICGNILPTYLMYLHAEDGLIDLGNPVGTQWHELWPFFCHEYHLSSWNDTSGNGVLSHCDWIDMYEKPDGAVKPYHVEDVTITLNVTPEEGGEPMFIEYEGGYDLGVLTSPIGSQWHEIYPDFCREYQVIGWNDTGDPTGVLDYCDYVLLAPKGCYGALNCPLDEDFSSWLPSGWTTDNWTQSFTNYAGGTSPEAVLDWNNIYGDYAYLDSKPIDTTGAPCLTLEFKSFIYDYCGSGNYNCTVYTRADGGDVWTDVTPWSNPIYGNVGPDTYSIDISSDIGTATQVRFEFSGSSWCINDWYVDDVSICYPEPTWWHVEGVATDIAVSREPPPVGGEAYPVNKASLLAPWIAIGVVLAGGISCSVLRRRKAQS